MCVDEEVEHSAIVSLTDPSNFSIGKNIQIGGGPVAQRESSALIFTGAAKECAGRGYESHRVHQSLRPPLLLPAAHQARQVGTLIPWY